MPIYVNNQLIPTFQFNGGERSIDVSDRSDDKSIKYSYTLHVKALLYNSNDIMDMLLTVNALQSQFKKIILYIPYLPYARQDRKCNDGEALSIKVMANLINSMNVSKVFIDDAHSDVAPALIDNCVNKDQLDIFRKNSSFLNFLCYNNLTLISPDAGAEKKIRKLQSNLGHNVVYCTKERDVKTGEIKGVTIPNCDLKDESCIIIDDICDGGRTFIELAKKLKSDKRVNKVYLYVTHGIFSNGFEELKKYIDGIYCKNIFPQTEDFSDYVTILD